MSQQDTQAPETLESQTETQLELQEENGPCNIFSDIDKEQSDLMHQEIADRSGVITKARLDEICEKVYAEVGQLTFDQVGIPWEISKIVSNNTETKEEAALVASFISVNVTVYSIMTARAMEEALSNAMHGHMSQAVADTNNVEEAADAPVV